MKEKTQKKYKNEEIINTVEAAADKILKEKGSNRHRDKFFPMLITKMGYKFAFEIGTDQGLFSQHLMKSSNLEQLYCVDPWIDDFGSNYKPGFYNKDGSKRMEDARKNLQEYLDKGRCVLCRGFSFDVSKNIEDGSIDFVYIDGDHSLEGIYTDIYTWTPKVKIGGVIAGHDYKDGPKSGMKDYFGNQLPYKIKTVVDNFCLQYGYKLNVVGGRICSWYFAKNKEMGE